MPTLKQLKSVFADAPAPAPTIFRRKSVLTFGKYKGRLVKDVLEFNSTYIYWLIQNTKIQFSKKVQNLAYNGYLQEACDRPRSRPSYSRSTYYRHADWDHDEFSEWGPGEFDSGGNMGFW